VGAKLPVSGFGRVHIRRVRLAALLLLLTQASSLAYGLTPFMASHCRCEHGPQIPCDCPHHERLAGKDMPPCHLHAKHDPSAPTNSAHCSLRAHCGSTPPMLLLLTLASIPEVARPMPKLPTAQPSAPPASTPPSPFLSPPRQPPKATT
jgi:hypothetical protein